VVVTAVLLLGRLHHFLLFFQHLFVKVLVVVVSQKSFLNVFLVKQLHVLLNLLAVLVFPLAVGVVGIEVVLVWWDEW
jgi:hypothetical protein